MSILNVTTSDAISLAVWVVIVAAVIIWAQGFRRNHRDIIGHRKFYYIFTSCMLLFCLAGIFGKGLNYGLDFTGGTILELGAPKMVTVTPAEIVDMVKSKYPDFDVTVQLGDSLINPIPDGDDDPSNDLPPYQKILVRVRSDASTKEVGLTPEQANEIRAMLEKGINVGKLENISETSVGPTMSNELKTGAIKALMIACILQLIYITFRFGNQLRFGASAVAAVLHGSIIMVGLYAWAGFPVDSNFVAALLTITSYSLMDTVVIFDRIREHMHNDEDGTFEQLTNRAVCETMTRSVNSSLTTLVVCLCLYYMGGESLQSFAYALIVGIITGGYSSICVSAPLVVDCDAYAKQRDLRREEELRLEAEESARKPASNIKSSGNSRRPVRNRPAPRKVEPSDSGAEGQVGSAQSEGGAPEEASGQKAPVDSGAPAGYASARPRRRVKGMRKKS